MNFFDVISAYYKSASQILPIAYKMFDDTVAKQKENFDWTPEKRSQLETVSFTPKKMQKLLVSACNDDPVGLLDNRRNSQYVANHPAIFRFQRQAGKPQPFSKFILSQKFFVDSRLT